MHHRNAYDWDSLAYSNQTVGIQDAATATFQAISVPTYHHSLPAVAAQVKITLKAEEQLECVELEVPPLQ